MRLSSTHLFMFTEHLPCARTYGLCENCNNKPGKFYPCSCGIERRMCLSLPCVLRKLSGRWLRQLVKGRRVGEKRRQCLAPPFPRSFSQLLFLRFTL